MQRSELEFFLNRTVKLNCQILNQNSEPINLFYNGIVVAVNDKTLHLRDKFDKLVVLNIESITTIQEI